MPNIILLHFSEKSILATLHDNIVASSFAVICIIETIQLIKIKKKDVEEYRKINHILSHTDLSIFKLLA